MLFILSIVKLFTVGDAVNVPDGIVNAEPLVFPVFPNIKLEVALVVSVPLVLTIGVFPVINVRVLPDTSKVPFVRVNVPSVVPSIIKSLPSVTFPLLVLLIANAFRLCAPPVKYIVPREPVPPTLNEDVLLPVIVPVPDAVPLSVKVFPLITNAPLVRVIIPPIVKLEPRLKLFVLLRVKLFIEVVPLNVPVGITNALPF